MIIDNKVVLITGASEGIGRATALLFGSRGAKLSLSARSEGRLQEVASGIRDAIVVPTDMAKPAEVREMIRATYRHYGCLDILVNNAGQGMYSPIERIRLDDLDQLMKVNL